MKSNDIIFGYKIRSFVTMGIIASFHAAGGGDGGGHVVVGQHESGSNFNLHQMRL